MTNKKRVVIFFVGFIALIYLYGILSSILYQDTIKNTESINLEKTLFYNVNDSEMTIENRELEAGESQVYLYQYDFTVDSLDELKLSIQHNENIYLMIEKPDANYFEVKLNNQNIGSIGDLSGNSNIWNGTYFIMFNENILQDENKLTILLKSSYMTGIAGSIRFLNAEDYHTVLNTINNSMDLIKSASIIAFLIAVLLGIVALAWYKELYNIKVYIYFFISIVAIGISLYDFRVIHLLQIDYLLFKKIIMISYHVTITFATLAIASLLNAKFKVNIGMIGLTLIIIRAFTSINMIEWRSAYTVLNLFLLASIAQLLITLIYYRKRAPIRGSILILGFSLSGITVTKLIVITNLSLESTMLTDLPILIIIYAALVLFVFYIELIQMVANYDLSGDELQSMSLQGSFTIDATYNVVGAYTNSCNTIFDRLIVGHPLIELMYEESEKEFIINILESVFDPKIGFKDGFIDLLPNEVILLEKHYKVYYSYIKSARHFLKVTLNDVTQIINLKEQLNQQNWNQRFLINALKSKSELSYFISKTENFLKTVRSEGFTTKNQNELHTLKGNLGQFGFLQFEKTVHKVETRIENNDGELLELVDLLQDELLQAIMFLEENIGADCFVEKFDELTIKKQQIDDLTVLYEAVDGYDVGILKQIKHLKYVDIKNMLSRYVEYIDRIANDLEKAILPLEIEGETVFVEPSKTEDLMMVLVGIFRNSVTHGIEFPEDRIESGKDSYGIIGCKIHTENNNMILRIKDDGAGIDTVKILNKAINSGILSIEESVKLSRTEILKMIFMNKLSSTKESNLLSGRGIGLSAVVETVNTFNGSIDIDSKEGVGTEFIISVPLDELVD